MFSVLVVDDDSTCLIILRAFLQNWNYEVTAVKHAYDAICALRAKPYDLVLSDVHMPNMDGFELQRHINQEFCLPVILISSDSQAELKGVQNGAQCFLVKPIVADDVKYIWQFSLWWKNKLNNSTPPIREINSRSQENVVRNNAVSSDGVFNARTGKLVWSRDLHTRFVEALIILGYHDAVPRIILDVMNVPGLAREQVASHLQKYRIFLQRILDGDAEMNNSHWIDFNYYSSVVSGNPHLMLINQLRDEKRTGKLSAPIPAGNLSSSSGGNRILPPFTPAEASSRRNMNAMWMTSNYASSSVNVTAEGLGSTTLGNACNANMGDIVGSSTIFNPFQNLKYDPNQMGYYNQNMPMAPQNYSYNNGGLVRGANNNMFSSTYHIGTSSTAPFHNNFYSKQAFNIGGPGSNDLFCGHKIHGGQQLGAGAGQLTDQNLFSGDNINGGQLGIMQRDPNAGIAFHANQFGITSAVNEHHQAGEFTAQKSWFDDNEVLSPDNFLLGPNLIPGEDKDLFWDDIMNVVVAEDKDVGVADHDKDAENSVADGKDDEHSRVIDKDVGVADEKVVGVADDKDAENSGDDDKDDENSGDDDDVDYNPEEDC